MKLKSVGILLAAAAVGTLVGLRFSAAARSASIERIRLDFTLAAAQNATLVGDALRAPEIRLDSLRRLFENSDQVTPDEFAGFTAPWTSADQGLSFAVLDAERKVAMGFVDADLHYAVAELAAECDAGTAVAAELVTTRGQRQGRLAIVRALPPGKSHRYIAVVADLERRLLNAIPPGRDWGLRTSVAPDDGQKKPPEPRPLSYALSMETAGIGLSIRVDAAPEYLQERSSIIDYLMTPVIALLFTLLAHTLNLMRARGDKAERLRKIAFEDLDHFFSLDLDMFCITDSNDIFLRVNPAWKRIFGYQPSDLIGTCFLDLIHPDDRIEATRKAGRGEKSGSISGFVTRALRKDGTWLRVEWKSAVVGDHVYTAARDVTEREEYEAKLRKTLAEKETLLREVHHRVKNNMQIISSMLNLQGGEAEDPALSSAIESAQGRIRTMAMVHDALYHSSDFIDIDFDEFARNLAAYCVYSMDRRDISLEVEPSGIRLGLDLAIPCGLILNELVSNSAKFAFAAAAPTRLRIALSEIGDKFALEVSDDGAGVGADFKIDSRARLGLRLVESLSDQLGGKLEIARGSEAGGGARFRIEFKPLPGSFVSRLHRPARL